jgi:4-hydroxy-tetrahydrodipicolinate synthase
LRSIPQLCRIYADWQGEAGRAAQARIDAMLAVLRRFSFFAALKELMAQRTGDHGWRRVRPPLCPLDARRTVLLTRQLHEIGSEVVA